jgi:hypothetical protein
VPAANQEHPQQQGAQVLPVQEQAPLPVDEPPQWVPEHFPWPLPPTLNAWDPPYAALAGNMLLTKEQQRSCAGQATDATVRAMQKLTYLLCDGRVVKLSVLRTQLYPTVNHRKHKASRSAVLQQARNGGGLLLQSVPSEGGHNSPAGHMRRLLTKALDDIDYLDTFDGVNCQ